MKNDSTVLCIIGPTACGKTALSVALAKQTGGEIISADAVAVYRGLDIGSAKPTEEERQGIPHHLIDCADPTDDSFTVSTFRSLAREAIDLIRSKNKLAIVVGGSGLYLDAIFSDMRFSAPSDPLVRAKLENAYDRDQQAVFEALRAADPVTAERLHVNDKKRVVRALEVLEITGELFSKLNRDFETAQKEDETYRVVRVGLNTERRILYDRIEKRVDEMFAKGLQKEAFSFFERGLTPDNCRALQSIGYAQLYDVFLGRETIEAAADRIKLDTRHFAKRQITWFKRNKNTVWFDPFVLSTDSIINTITELLNEH
jgi:tRNA dimethylallyltransferase